MNSNYEKCAIICPIFTLIDLPSKVLLKVILYILQSTNMLHAVHLITDAIHLSDLIIDHY